MAATKSYGAPEGHMVDMQASKQEKKNGNWNNNELFVIFLLLYSSSGNCLR